MSASLQFRPEMDNDTIKLIVRATQRCTKRAWDSIGGIEGDSALAGMIPDILEYTNEIAQLYNLGDLNVSRRIAEDNRLVNINVLSPIFHPLYGRNSPEAAEVGFDLESARQRASYTATGVWIPYIHGESFLSVIEAAKTSGDRTIREEEQNEIAQSLEITRETQVFQGGAGVPGLTDASTNCTLDASAGVWETVTAGRLENMRTDMRTVKQAFSAQNIVGPFRAILTPDLYTLLEGTSQIYQSKNELTGMLEILGAGSSIDWSPYLAPAGTQMCLVVPKLKKMSTVRIYYSGIMPAQNSQLYGDEYGFVTRVSAINQKQSYIRKIIPNTSP